MVKCMYRKTFMEVNIDNINCKINEYMFAIFVFFGDILTPTKNNDIWSQLNTNKEEIKNNSKNITKLYKKNTIYFTWEEYHAVLANGYLYFYSSLEDEEYQGYFFLRDAEIHHQEQNNLIITLDNKLGSIEIMFSNEDEMKQWEVCVRERISEMKTELTKEVIENEEINEQQQSKELQKEAINDEEIQFSAVINIRNIHGKVVANKEESFSLDVSAVILTATIRNLDYEIRIKIIDVYANDLLAQNESLKKMIYPFDQKHDKQSIEKMKINELSDLTPLVEIVVVICDEKSKKYKNIQFDVSIFVKSLIVFWHPNSIRKLFTVVVHTDIMKRDVELEIFNKDIQSNTFIKPSPIRLLQQKCTEFTYTYVKVFVEFEKINIIWIQPILNEKFACVMLDKCILNADLKVDHYQVSGSLDNTQLFDLSNYPYGYKPSEPIQEHKIFGKKEGSTDSFISFDYTSMYEFCPMCKDNYLGIANVKINSIYLVYMHEHFLRVFNYLMSEFLGGLSASEEVRRFQNEQYNISPKHEKDIDFMKINLIITSPQMIAKPRFGYTKDYFIIDLDSVGLTCGYDKVYGKLRSEPSEYRWLTTYQFTLNNLLLKTSDDFSINKPFNAFINMHLTEYTESDKLWLDEMEFDFSYQFDISVPEVEANIRQKDFTNFMKCIDLNIIYTDNKEKEYDFEMCKLNMKKNKKNKDEFLDQLSKTDRSNSTHKEREKLRELYYDVLANIFVTKIKANLYLENGKTFTELVLSNASVNVVRKLTMNKYVDISISNMDAYHIGEKTQYKENILSNIKDDTNEIKNDEEMNNIMSSIEKLKIISKEQYQQLASKGGQCEIKVNVYSNFEKSLKICINGFKLIFRYDTLNLIRYFFVEGLPFYHSTEIDLPNDFDPNEENSPPLSFVLEIKKPLICLLTDSLKNKAQNMLCVTSDVFIGIKTEMMSKVKRDLVNKSRNGDNNESGYVSSLNISLLDICPFIIKMSELNTIIDDLFSHSKENLNSVRKLTDSFMLSFETKDQIDIVNSASLTTLSTSASSPPPSFAIKSISRMNVNKITIKSSYRDIVLLSSTFEYNTQIMSSSFNANVDSLCSYTKSKKEKKETNESLDILGVGVATATIYAQGVQIILIDDHANTFYPFVCFSLSETNITSEMLNNKTLFISADTFIKALSFNYIAGVWEPILEKSKFNIDIEKEPGVVSSESLIVQIKAEKLVNINISDLSLSFLFKTLTNWIDKLKKVREKRDSINKLEESAMKITNHTVVNYSGRNIVLFRLDSNNDKHLLSVVAPNRSYEIEYFVNNTNDNENGFMTGFAAEKYISFSIENLPIISNVLKIDSIQSKIHIIDFKSSPYDFIVSTITLKKLKKFVYFYSPLCFKNKTPFPIYINLIKKGLEVLKINLPQKGTTGIPYEYLVNGTFQLTMNGINSKIYPMSSFINDREIIEEINFNGQYVNLYIPKNDNRNKIIRIRTSYSIRNCLPFSIQVVLNEQNEMFEIGKGDITTISSISIKKSLKCFLFFYNFHSKKELILFNVKDTKNLPSTITLEDNEGGILSLNISIIKRDSIIVVLHASSILINHTTLPLQVYGARKDQLIKIPNQQKNFNFFILNDERNIVLSYNDEINGIYTSKKIASNAIGTTSIVELTNAKNKNEKIIFIVDISLSLLNIEFDIYSTIVKLVPRIVIYNKLNVDTLVALDEKIVAKISSGNKLPLFDFDEKKMIRFKMIEQEQSEYDYSSPISLASNSFTTIKSAIKNDNQIKSYAYINVEKKLNELSTYIIASHTDISTSQIVVENYSNVFDTKLFQFGYEQGLIYLPKKSKTMFAFDNSYTNTAITVQFITLDFPVEDCSYTFDILDERVYSRSKSKDFTYPHFEIIAIPLGINICYKVRMIFSSDSRKFSVKIFDFVENSFLNVALPNERTSEFELNITFDKIGISVIGDNKNIEKKAKYSRNEICYITLDQVVVYNKRKIVNETTRNETQIVVKEIEIDNEIAYIKQFPVVLIPYSRKKGVHKKEVNTSKNTTRNNTSSSYINTSNEIENPFFNFAMVSEVNQSDDVTKILLFNYLIQEFILNIESCVLVGFINFVQNIAAEMRTSFTKINPIFVSEQELPQEIVIKENYFKPQWIDKVNISSNQNIFISQLSASSLELHLTFINATKDKVFQKILQSNKILSSILSAISNIEGVHIKLNGCEMANFVGELKEIIGSIALNYQQNILVKLLKLAGAIDILGDPLNLISSLGKGFKDFFAKPAKGMMKGPLQGAIGLVDGTLSLAKHTFDGTMNSTSKLTSGISKSMLMLTQDDDYINRRERRKITQRPKNLIEGIGYGLSSMAGGIFYGVTDIVKKPIEGAKADKLKGFGKGLLKGLSGVVFKPISGVFDLVSKTTEGIKNTVKNDDTFNPIRIPRSFYGKYKIIKPYNYVHAQVMMLLSTNIDELKGQIFDFYNCEIYKNSKNDSILLAFLSGGIYTINLLTKELKSVIEYRNIKEVNLDDSGKIVIVFNKSIEKRMFTSINIFNSSCEPKKIVEKIKSAIESSYEDGSIQQKM